MSIFLALFPQNGAVSFAAGKLYGWSVGTSSIQKSWLVIWKSCNIWNTCILLPFTSKILVLKYPNLSHINFIKPYTFILYTLHCQFPTFLRFLKLCTFLIIIAIAAYLFNMLSLCLCFVFKHAWGLREPGKRLEGEHCHALYSWQFECLVVAPVYLLAPIFNGS